MLDCLRGIFATTPPYLSRQHDVPMPSFCDRRVNVPFTLGVQLDVVHVWRVANSHPMSEPVSISTLSIDLAEGVEAYAEQLWISILSMYS